MAKKFKFTGGADKWTGTSKDETVNAKGGDDILNGKGGDDTINGGSGDDKIIGGKGNDTLNGGSGDDAINASIGNDTVDGGTGDDTVTVSGNFADATITKTGEVYTIVTANGTVTVTNVEHVTFADGTKDAADLIPVEGIKVDLTTLTDTFTTFTTADDTITGLAGTLNDADIIIDNTATDNDTMNLTLNAINGKAKVSGIENINVTWDAFGTALFDATNVTGADITISSTKVGYLGDVTITAAGANTIIAGTGAVGALTVNGATAVTVDAANAATATVAASGVVANDTSATVTAGASTTSVTTTGGFVTNTVTGGAATTAVTVAGQVVSLVDVANVTLSKSATFTQANVETVNLTAGAGTTVTLASALSAAATATNSIKSDGAVTLAATGAQLAGLTLTDATTGLTVDLSAGTGNLSKIAADTFNLKSALAGDTTVASGSTVVAGIANAFGASKFLGTAATGESLNLTVGADQATVTVDAALETLNISTALAATDVDKIATITTLTANAATLSGADKVTIGTLAATSLDASKATGALTINAVSATTASVVGSATAANTVAFGAVNTVDTSYVGGNGADVITGVLTEDKAFSAVLGDGANSFASSGLKAGSVTVLGGSGVDTITISTAAAAAGGTVVIQSAGGDDVATVTLGLGGTDVLNANLGDGNDTFKFGGSTEVGDSITLDGGAGTADILDLNGANNISAFTTLSVSNFEVIDDSAGTATVDGSLLTGKTYEIRGVGAASTLAVTIGTAGSYDFSKLVLNNTLTDATVGLAITGNAGNDTIVATSGTDTITSNGGNDTITGGAGADTITLGGAGSLDTLIFNSLTGADAITAYTVADDSIQLSLGTYTALGAVGALTAAEFVSGAGLTNGQDASDRIVYNTTTGDLYYDADGSGAGASVLLGTFAGTPALVVGEFTIIA